RAAQLFAQEQTSSIIAKLTITIAAAVAAAVVPVEGSSNPGSPISSYLQFLRDGTSASNDLCPMSHDAKSPVPQWYGTTTHLQIQHIRSDGGSRPCPGTGSFDGRLSSSECWRNAAITRSRSIPQRQPHRFW
ncbi:hypothetical protein JG687_00008257, partial [Phytophthora cactorum]